MEVHLNFVELNVLTLSRGVSESIKQHLVQNSGSGRIMTLMGYVAMEANSGTQKRLAYIQDSTAEKHVVFPTMGSSYYSSFTAMMTL